MKITCQACAAKYTIADEKVRGKTVKIKCKKCGASIVASGKEGDGGAAVAGASAELFWTVNVGEGDQRSVSAAEIEQLLSAGYVNADSFAWRDGMSDWLPLAQVPELSSLFAAPAMEMSGSPEISAMSHDVGGREIDEDMPTKMERGASLLDMASAPAAATPSGPFAGGPSPFAPQAAPAPAPAPAARAARAAAPSGGDLFAPKAPEPVAPAPMRPGNIINDEASGLIDIRNLSASLGSGGPPKPPVPQKSAFDDVMGLGGQPLFAQAPMMAPPDLNAPPPPPPAAPQPFGAPPGPVSASPGFSAVPPPPQKKSSAGLIIGVIGLVLAAGGIGALVMSKKGGDEQKTAIAADTKTADPAKSADAPKPTESVALAPTSTVPSTAPEGAPAADKAADAAGTAKADDKKKAADDKGTDKAADKKKRDEEKKKEEEAKKKEEEAKKKEAEKKKEPDPPAGGGSDAAFDRGAAMSAMGTAANGVSACKKSDGPTGSGRVSVTFAPSGNVTQAVVNGEPFAGTAVGGCVAAKFRSAKVPPFGGSPVTVNKTFTIN